MCVQLQSDMQAAEGHRVTAAEALNQNWLSLYIQPKGDNVKNGFKNDAWEQYDRYKDMITRKD